MGAVKDTQAMIAQMRPTLRDGLFVFRTLKTPRDAAPFLGSALASFVEDEGLSLILPDDGTGDHPMRCITLMVHSALDGIGLTAAVAVALSDHGIPCNMVAAFHHDHVFVPAAMADQAVEVLLACADAAQDRR